MSKRPRRRYSPEEKAKILRLHLLEHVPISEICEKQGIQRRTLTNSKAEKPATARTRASLRIVTSKLLSRLTGWKQPSTSQSSPEQTTIIKEQATRSGRGFLGTQVSTTMQEVQRPLLTPDECQRMPGPQKDEHDRITAAGDMVIYCAGSPGDLRPAASLFRG